MPIRINLLAEAQAAEELRRRDPVKRVIFVGILLTLLALGWSGMIGLQLWLARGGLTEVRVQVDTQTNEFQKVKLNLNKLATINNKLTALKKLSDSRLLQGTLLNALQQCSVDNMQLTRLKIDQGYVRVEGTPTVTNSSGRITPGRPGQVTEKVVLTLDARDFSANPGSQFGSLKSVIANNPYFKTMLETNGIQLASQSAPQTGADGRQSVLFTLECHYPDKIR
jgi:hypothetical protein